ncbi:NAD-binding protein [Candidatus Oleimmundimicrobium sp.]|uniref:potassium channel family protein n=1 Tax=Candidatus Oleimmundimicrobium sp. TaxID=3060597 RepID=UPI00271C23A0|nr:NAD-binding protein [Candidatus Oleimmundimicrobium sp.]MDO8886844.1 NAD-binding protein [Candidatus Oleimmundimicrobium sp.]
MFIVINGGGKVGSALAQKLKKKKHKVVIIERDKKVCTQLATDFPDVMIIHGDGCDVSSQEDAGTSHANVFASVTGDDDDNLVACELAKAAFNVPRMVARVNSPKNERIFHKMGIEAISSTTIISRLIEEEATIGDLITLYTLKKGQIALVEVELPAEKCKVCHKKIAEIKLPENCVIATIVRGNKAIIPHGNTVLRAGDSIIALTSIEKEKELKEVLTS